MNTSQLHSSVQQAYFLLRLVFVILPILVGFDKFFNFFVDWEQYFVNPLFGTRGHFVLLFVGLVEMGIGIGILYHPRLFANLLAIWIALVGLNLIILGKYIDIAILDFGLGLCALALGKLAKSFAT